MIDDRYENHIVECWKWSEKIAIKCGSPDNKTVVAIFDKIASPYHFFKQDNRNLRNVLT